jgi:hypothetical protein
MGAAVPPLPQYASMAWCSEGAQGQLLTQWYAQFAEYQYCKIPLLIFYSTIIQGKVGAISNTITLYTTLGSTGLQKYTEKPLINTAMNRQVIQEARNFFTLRATASFSGWTLLHGFNYICISFWFLRAFKMEWPTSKFGTAWNWTSILSIHLHDRGLPWDNRLTNKSCQFIKFVKM